MRNASRVSEVVDSIRGRIASGTLSQGDRLPSIRGYAATLAASPSTIVEAYDRLVSEGVIGSRPGSGFYVSARLDRADLNNLPMRPDRVIDPLWVSRQSLDASPETLRPGCGWLPASWMPNGLVRSALRDLARQNDSSLVDYGPSRGLPDLRQFLSRRCVAEGMEVSASKSC